MQAYLPDINTAYISYRGEAIRSIKSEHYDSAFGAVYSLNALLPEEYRVRISSIEYDKIRIFDLLLPLLQNMISQKTSEKVWLCPSCKNLNKLDKTEFKKEVLAEPTIFKIVPKPPERKDGLIDRNSYDRKVSKWLWNMLSELEAAMSEFRKANWNQGGEEMDQNQIDTTGEIND